MFKNAFLYRIAKLPAVLMTDLIEAATRTRFVECGPTQRESYGWTPPRGEKHGAMVEYIGGELIFRMLREERRVPAAVVKRELDKRLEKIEADTGRRPKGKVVKDMKAEIEHELLPRAFPRRSTALAWIDASAQVLLVDAGNQGGADLVASMLVELFGGGVGFRLIQCERSATSCMSAWLATREAPAFFTIDRECVLQQPDSERALVKYARHTLDTDEVGEHIAQGKLPTQLAMTWNSRVSFVLTDAMALKHIELLDVAMEGDGAAGGGFDTDVAISTGELRLMIPHLLDALGGEAAPDLVEDAAQGEADDGPDPMLAQAREIVLEHKRASISLVQRHLRIGYNRAARLLEALQATGVVSAMNTTGERSVLAQH